MQIQDAIQQLRDDDFHWLSGAIGSKSLFEPDRTLAAHGEPHMFRWHVVRSRRASVYVHLHVGDDPQHLHDHPWDSQSVIIAGGYDEVLQGVPTPRKLRAGDIARRYANQAHRIVLPSEIPYCLSLFSVGPVKREWGFYLPDGWRSHKELIHVDENGVSHATEETRRG